MVSDDDNDDDDDDDDDDNGLGALGVCECCHLTRNEETKRLLAMTGNTGH